VAITFRLLPPSALAIKLNEQDTRDGQSEPVKTGEGPRRVPNPGVRAGRRTTTLESDDEAASLAVQVAKVPFSLNQERLV
jgi:hypothetical protein